MSAPAKKDATYEDLVAAPDNMVAELIGGSLITSPRPAGRHGHATVQLTGALLPFDLKKNHPGGWWFIVEPELHFDNDVLVPDIAAWRREHLPEDRAAAYYTRPPDWVCEVLSPSNFRMDRLRKLPRYAQVGVAHAWLVDPEGQGLEVWRNDQAGHFTLMQTAEEAAKIRAEPFDAMELDLASLWL